MSERYLKQKLKQQAQQSWETLFPDEPMPRFSNAEEWTEWTQRQRQKGSPSTQIDRPLDAESSSAAQLELSSLESARNHPLFARGGPAVRAADRSRPADSAPPRFSDASSFSCQRRSDGRACPDAGFGVIGSPAVCACRPPHSVPQARRDCGASGIQDARAKSVASCTMTDKGLGMWPVCRKILGDLREEPVGSGAEAAAAPASTSGAAQSATGPAFAASPALQNYEQAVESPVGQVWRPGRGGQRA